VAESVIEVILRARNASRQAFTQLKRDIGGVQQETTDAAASAKELESNLNVAGRANISRAGRGVGNLADQLQRAQRQSRELESRLNRIAEVGGRVGRALTGIGAAGSALFGTSVVQASNLSTALSQVQAVSGATATDLTTLEATTRNLGATTRFTAVEAAQGLVFLAQAGLSVSEANQALAGTLQLASAGGLSLAQASDIATNVLAAFQLKVSDLGKVNDTLAFTASNANTNVSQLAEAFKAVGPIANSIGLNIQQVSGTLAVLADAGIRGGEAGTALRNIFLRLQNPPKAAADALERLGVAVIDIEGNTRPTLDVLNDLGKAQISAADAADIFGLRAAAAGTVLVSNFDKAKASVEELGISSEGAAARIATLRENNLEGDFRKLTSAINDLFIEIGQSLAPSLRNLVQKLTQVAAGISDFFKSLSEGGQQFIVISAAAAALVTVLGIVVIAFSGLASLIAPFAASLLGVGAAGSAAAAGATAAGAGATAAATGATAATGAFGALRAALIAVRSAFLPLAAFSVGAALGGPALELLLTRLDQLHNIFTILGSDIEDAIGINPFSIINEGLGSLLKLFGQLIPTVAESRTKLGALGDAAIVSNLARIDQSLDAVFKKAQETDLINVDTIREQSRQARTEIALFRNDLRQGVIDQEDSARLLNTIIQGIQDQGKLGILDPAAVKSQVDEAISEVERLQRGLREGTVDVGDVQAVSSRLRDAFTVPLQQAFQARETIQNEANRKLQQFINEENAIQKAGLEERLANLQALQAQNEALVEASTKRIADIRKRNAALQTEGSALRVQIAAENAQRIIAIENDIRNAVLGSTQEQQSVFAQIASVRASIAIADKAAANATTEAERKKAQAALDSAREIANQITDRDQQITQLRLIQRAEENVAKQSLNKAESERKATEEIKKTKDQRVKEQAAVDITKKKIEELQAKIKTLSTAKINVDAQTSAAERKLNTVSEIINRRIPDSKSVDIVVNVRRGAQEGGIVLPNDLFLSGGGSVPGIDGNLLQRIAFKYGGAVKSLPGLTQRVKYQAGGKVKHLDEELKRVHESAKRHFTQNRLKFRVGGTVPALVEDGEFIIPADKARNFMPLLNAINSGTQNQILPIINRMKEIKGALPKGRRRGFGKIPGYGGGDRRPMTLPSGSFVVRKERTKAFLPMLNAMMAGNQNKVSALLNIGNAQRRLGGAVGSINNNYVRMQDGGQLISNLPNKPASERPASVRQQERITEKVALDLTIQGQNIGTLTGDRKTVDSVVRSLNDLSKTLGGGGV